MSVISEKLKALEKDMERTLIKLDCKMASIKNREINQAKNEEMKALWEEYQEYKRRSSSKKRIKLYNEF